MSMVVFTLLSLSCSRSNNLVLGRVEAMVGEHKVEVTDCYRVNPPHVHSGSLIYRMVSVCILTFHVGTRT